MTTTELGTVGRRLTSRERQQFRDDGYLTGLPLFDVAAVGQLQRRFGELCELLPAGVEMGRVNCWHKANRWVDSVCRTPALLDCVEDLVGPNFYLWGAQFFCKFPGDGSIVPWHQDAQYWPLSPRKAVTAWIAFFDTDRENAAMQVVKVTHRGGDVEHRTSDNENYILPEEIDSAAIDASHVISLDLHAGEMSLHDDGLIHGSGANNSDRVRVGLALRFCATDVKCDLSGWPNFETYLVRGIDEFHHNPPGKIPMQDGFPTGKFQLSSEFE
jgi:hypothetical protein